MKLLFTKLQEEITTVKKSVTQFRVETGSDIKNAEFPVIEIKPESQRIEHAEAIRHPKASFDNRKTPLALTTKTEQVNDIVDLQGIPKKAALSPVTYSTNRVLAARPCLESFKDDRFSKSENDHSQGKVAVYSEPEDREAFSALEEKRAKYQLTTRKFIATQEMIEYHTNKEKRLSFELTI
jgi:hypothetical protein